MIRALTVVCVVLLAGLSISAAPPPAVTGDYIEVRSNHVYTCACLFSGEQVTGGREAILAWNVREGEYRGTPLAGAKAVAVMQGPESLSLPGTARRSAMFVDAADAEAREALVALLREYYGNVLGEVFSVEAAPISFQKEGERVTVNVGEVSRFVVRPARLPEDAHLGSFLWYDPFIPTTASTLGATEYTKFWGSHFRHQWWEADAGITGYLGTFGIAR
ncbi:MAG: DUF1326 domain-containing protein [Acidobacteriota bacterium]